MDKIQSVHHKLINKITELFAPLPQVEAIAVAGSRGSGSGTIDSTSDIDLYVYTRDNIPVDVRERIAEDTGGVIQSNFDMNYWGAGDLWINAPTGIEMDVMYFDVTWMEDQIIRVIEKHQPSLGYTTCFWFTVRQSILFYDKVNWFTDLQQRCTTDYPEALRQNIIRYNHPVLRGIITSYAAQIEKAVKRHDLLSINHRLAAFFASYFDIIFALNRQLHPGEKRQLAFAVDSCGILPDNLSADIESILSHSAADIGELPNLINNLLDSLDMTLKKEGINYNSF